MVPCMAADMSGFDPALDVRLDAESLRVLAHPLRVQLLSRLRLTGPATASQLGQQLGQSSGATSYHLRQLEAYGFVVEDTDRGTRRERWWRAAHRTTRFDMTLDDETRATGGEYMRAVARNYSDRMLRFADSIETADQEYGAEWADVYTLSDWTLHLSAARAADLHRDVFELMQRYRDEPAPDDAGTLVAQVQLFPPP